ncbi:hypothetical protein Y032_0006g3095 [Ancylostoma ceylanicum]|uniref:Uncharacterized protein n=1 Tax=Ancylostoma ceylanicum TaxID=53326 RepID=A0A016VSB3_9BILA|nr:hypothetical protein Y032_0006g3095 [Ancylostoma ceylanicum]
MAVASDSASNAYCLLAARRSGRPAVIRCWRSAVTSVVDSPSTMATVHIDCLLWRPEIALVIDDRPSPSHAAQDATLHVKYSNTVESSPS